MIQDKLIEYRRKNGFTQQEVSDLIGVERSTYACYETGKAAVPLGKLQLLSVIYNVDLNDFNTSTMLELRSEQHPVAEKKEESITSQDERMIIAKMRLLRAMGREEELNRALDELVDKE